MTEKNTKLQMFLNHPIFSISKSVNPPSPAEGGVLRSFTRKYESFSLSPVQLMTSRQTLHIFLRLNECGKPPYNLKCRVHFEKLNWC